MKIDYTNNKVVGDAIATVWKDMIDGYARSITYHMKDAHGKAYTIADEGKMLTIAFEGIPISAFVDYYDCDYDCRMDESISIHYVTRDDVTVFTQLIGCTPTLYVDTLEFITVIDDNGNYELGAYMDVWIDRQIETDIKNGEIDL